MPFSFDSSVPITRIKIGRIRQCCRIPISAEIKIMGQSTPRKMNASPFSPIPPKTKFVPSAANLSSDSKKPETCLIMNRPLSACRKKNASAISITISCKTKRMRIFRRSKLTSQASARIITSASRKWTILNMVYFQLVFEADI
ncbi:Uncharacterised protein [Enterobacter cloacae]|nr:Uncharacterised protein [Enterobacter cloacae]